MPCLRSLPICIGADRCVDTVLSSYYFPRMSSSRSIFPWNRGNAAQRSSPKQPSRPATRRAVSSAPRAVRLPPTMLKRVGLGLPGRSAPKPIPRCVPALVEPLARVAAIPTGETNLSCVPPPLPEQPACTDSAFVRGRRRARPAKIVLLVLFSFEADLLEIFLREVDGLVHKIVLVESTVGHQKLLPKPIVFDWLRSQPRFAGLTDRLERLVVPRTAYQERRRDDIWHAEVTAMDYARAHILEHAAPAKWNLTDDDLVINGNVDELLGRRALFELQRCELMRPVTSGALWMPLGTLTRAFKPDWAVAGQPFGFSLPTVYRLSALRTQRGHRLFRAPYKGQFVLGGIHLTNTPFVPLVVLKALSASEYHSSDAVARLRRLRTSADADAEQRRVERLQDHANWIGRTVPLHRLSSQHRKVLFTPWFLACNRARFPHTQQGREMAVLVAPYLAAIS